VVSALAKAISKIFFGKFFLIALEMKRVEDNSLRSKIIFFHQQRWRKNICEQIFFSSSLSMRKNFYSLHSDETEWNGRNHSSRWRRGSRERRRKARVIEGVPSNHNSQCCKVFQNFARLWVTFSEVCGNSANFWKTLKNRSKAFKNLQKAVLEGPKTSQKQW